MHTVKCRLTKLTTKSVKVKRSVSKRSAEFGLIPMFLWSYSLEIISGHIGVILFYLGFACPTPPLPTCTVSQYDRYCTWLPGVGAHSVDAGMGA